MTIILRLSLFAALTTCFAVQSADIIPTGFKLLLNGPRITLRITQGASNRRSVIKSPKARLLNSYSGLKAGLTSASEVLTQTSLVAICLLVLTVFKNNYIKRKPEKVFTS